ncbi:MAG: glycosyltransferase family 2 protein [Deltaproteobacteria bacterium]|nr:glycosyltransferase family 2 protein [Deltaproteobacteria bacterium]
MSKPLISCIIPAFNSDKYLAEALDSIVAQTYRPFEIIVADDGSTDTTAEVSEGYGDKVRFLSQKTAGPAATRNFGLQNAKGDFVAFLDADDLWHPEKLSLQMSRFEQQPELHLCVTHVKLIWTQTLREEQEQYQHHVRAKPVPGYATTTLLARREAFRRIGGFNAEYWFCDATDWFMRAKNAGLIMELLPDVLTYHRMHEGNLTRRKNEASRHEFLTIVNKAIRQRCNQ